MFDDFIIIIINIIFLVFVISIIIIVVVVVVQNKAFLIFNPTNLNLNFS